MKNVFILGATGSIGEQTIEACRHLKYNIVGITANSSYKKLYEQYLLCKPKFVIINTEEGYTFLKDKIPGKVYFGLDGLHHTLEIAKADIVVNAIVGSAGILPTVYAIKNSKRVALANKETLVSAGKLIMSLAKENNTEIIPVDSEHSAIFQSLDGQPIKKIHLTASGGPFRGYTAKQLEKVTLKDALSHPNWEMGKKITIDSATLMNKGLEVIEARWLFDVPATKIEVVVHPESIIHSIVEYEDHSYIAQIGAHDMRIPITYALTYPMRIANPFDNINFVELGKLTFFEPDKKTFPCLQLAYDALQAGNTMPLVLNAANEVAVSLFIQGKISFTNIWVLIEKIMNKHDNIKIENINELLELDNLIREKTLIGGNTCQ